MASRFHEPKQNHQVIFDDCLKALKAMPDRSVDLVFCSPPYENCRTYGIGFNLKGQAWVDWAVERFVECDRVSRGLTAWVVEGKTSKFQYSATPVLLMADLHRRGIKLRKPPIFYRVGIPGSGGPDWLRNDFEWIVCSSHGKMLHAENTAMGHAPKWAPGGEMSNRLSNGTRRNQWGHSGTGKQASRNADGSHEVGSRKSHIIETVGSLRSRLPDAERKKLNRDTSNGSKLITQFQGDKEVIQCYIPPALANPGNVIDVKVGGGLMGSRLAHENEASFPEKLAEFFIRSFCPMGGIVMDPFAGSGTVAAVAELFGRNSISIDCRQSQCDLIERRIQEAAERRFKLDAVSQNR